eukprot:UN09547
MEWPECWTHCGDYSGEMMIRNVECVSDVPLVSGPPDESLCPQPKPDVQKWCPPGEPCPVVTYEWEFEWFGQCPTHCDYEGWSINSYRHMSWFGRSEGIDDDCKPPPRPPTER